MHHQIGEHPQWVWPIVGTVHSDTLITTWGVMLFSLIFFAWLGSSYRSPASVRRTQATFEGMVNWLADLAIGTIGRRGERFVPVFVSMFMFIFMLNQIGFFPFKELGLPFGGSPTADLNTTFAYAVIVYVGIWVTAIARGGIGAFKHLTQPSSLPLAFRPFMTLLNVIEDLARPITLSLRLFFNIFVGELLIFVAVQIITSGIHIGVVDLSLAAAIAPFLIQFFNFFIGTLQAFVFTLLSIVYLSLATAEEH